MPGREAKLHLEEVRLAMEIHTSRVLLEVVELMRRAHERVAVDSSVADLTHKLVAPDRLFVLHRGISIALMVVSRPLVRRALQRRHR